MAIDGQFQVPGDMFVNGTFRANAMDIPDNSVSNSTFDISAPLDATKQFHQYLVKLNQNGTASTETRTVHQAYGDGRLIVAYATIKTAAIGAATVTLDVKKNGTSILSGAWVIGNTTVAFGVSLGTLNPASQDYLQDDVFEITATAAAGGGTLPTGLLVTLVLREGAGS